MATTYPTYPATTFEQAVELSIFASNQLHNVINGDATTTIETESGDIPSVRKALVDNFFFKTPIRWVSGNTSQVFNQLYYFYADEVVNGWYYAPSATTDNPITLGSTPVGDDNWILYTPVAQSIPSQVYPWWVEISQEQTSVSPPYSFDTAIVVYNGVVLTAGKDYTITDSVITFTSPLEVELDAEYPDILFCYLGKVEEGDPETNYLTYVNLAKDSAAALIGTSYGETVQDRFDKYLSTDGFDYIYSGEAKLSETTPPNIFEYMTRADIDAILTTVGQEVDVDYALQAIVSAGYMSAYYPWPKGVYVHGDGVTIPAGFNIIAEGSRKPYTISGDTSFNNCGVVIRKKSGATGIFKMSGRHTFKDIVFDGRDKLTGSINSSSQIAGLRFERCGFYRWTNGLGRTSGYLGTVYAEGCNLSGNNHGFYNFIDSRAIGCTINANTNHGINLQAGANNNSFLGVRVEWNGGYGLQAVAAQQNSYEGELIDRNGLAGGFC